MAIYQPNLTSAESSLRNKYGALGIPDDQAGRALAILDIQRSMRGQTPLTWRLGGTNNLNPLSQTALALAAARSGQPQAVKEPSLFDLVTGLPGHLLSDVRTTAQAVPHMFIPNRGNPLYREAGAITHLPEYLSKVRSPADLTTLPGVRWVPGAYTIGNLLGATNVETGQQGSWRELLAHPGFTALDIAPYASKLAAGTRVVQAAQGAYESQFAKLAEDTRAGYTPVYRPPRPLSTILTQRLPRAGEEGGVRIGGQLYPQAEGGVVPRLATRGARSTIDALDPSGVLRATFSGRARQITRQFGFASHQTANLLQGKGIEDFTKHFNAPEAGRIAQLSHEMSSTLPETLVKDESRRVAITSALERDDQAALSALNLSDAELAHVERARLLTGEIEDWAVRSQQLRRVMGTDFDPSWATTDEARRALTLAAGEVYHPEEYARIQKRYITARDARFDLDRAATLERDAARNIERAQPIVDALTPLARRDPVARDIVRALKRPDTSNIKVARAALNDIRKQLRRAAETNTTSRWADLPLDQVEEALTGVKEAGKSLRSRARITMTEQSAAALERRLAHSIAKREPKRFQPLLEEEMQRRARKAINERVAAGVPLATTPEEAMRLIDEGNIAATGLDEATRNVIERDVRGMWLTLKENGADPMFVSRAHPSAPIKLAYPRASTRMKAPSFVKQRVADFTPYRQDVFLNLPESTAQVIGTYINKELADTYKDFYGQPLSTVQARYVSRARGAGAPTSQVNAWASAAMERDWVPWNPDALMPPNARVKGWIKDADNIEYLIPRDVAKVIDQLQSPPGESFARLFDPLMKAFRMSVLSLSPRWHANNLIGGDLMLLARTGPGVFKYMSEARALLKKIEAGEAALPEGFPTGGYVSVPDVEGMIRESSAQQKTIAAASYLGGTKMRTMLSEFIEQHPGMQRFGRAINKVSDWSFGLNAMVDDMNRVMSYLYGYDKAIKRGLTEQEAAVRGVSLARKVMQEWDTMTPLERQVIRSVMPFYGWANHIVRYVYNMPFDHPWRTSITASIARTEFADKAVGEDFRNLLIFGSMDDFGNQSAVRTRGLNPFADVANYFTLSGLVGQTNPVLSALLQSLGVDPITGSADLYPDLHYDPKTGRLEAKTPNFFRTLVGSTIPQFRLVDQLGIDRAGWRDLVQRDPDAAGRFLMSAAGLPVIYQRTNRYTERMKAELARVEAMDTARLAAVKAGNWGALEQYPLLRDYAQQLRAMESSGQLDQFQAQGGGSVVDVVTGAAGSQARDAYDQQLRALAGTGS